MPDRLRRCFAAPKCQARTEEARHAIERTLSFVKAEKKDVEKAIDATIAELDEVAGAVGALESVKGVGRVTAATLLVTVPEFELIGRKPVAELVGVAPWNRDSGTKTGQLYIHGGRAAARCSLYVAALSAIRHNSPLLPTLYDRLRAKGKPAKVAIVACMRKLLIHLNSTMRRSLSRPTAAAVRTILRRRLLSRPRRRTGSGRWSIVAGTDVGTNVERLSDLWRRRVAGGITTVRRSSTSHGCTLESRSPPGLQALANVWFGRPLSALRVSLRGAMAPRQWSFTLGMGLVLPMPAPQGYSREPRCVTGELPMGPRGLPTHGRDRGATM